MRKRIWNGWHPFRLGVVIGRPWRIDAAGVQAEPTGTQLNGTQLIEAAHAGGAIVREGPENVAQGGDPEFTQLVTDGLAA